MTAAHATINTHAAPRNAAPQSPRDDVHRPHHEVEPTIYGIDKRLSLLEYMYKSQDKRLAEINGNLSKVVWLLITGIVVAVLSQIIPAV